MTDSSDSQHQSSNLPPKLSQPAQRALARAGCTRLEQLTSHSEAEILKLHGVGPRAIDLLRQSLAEKGLTFAGKA